MGGERIEEEEEEESKLRVYRSITSFLTSLGLFSLPPPPPPLTLLLSLAFLHILSASRAVISYVRLSIFGCTEILFK